MSLALVFFALPAAAQEEPAPEPPKVEEPAPEPPAPEPPAPEPPPPEPPKAKPSVIVDAKDEDGREVRNVTVLVDGAPIAYELPDTPIALEPGAHTIAVQRNDGPRERATASVVLVEGDTNHAVHLVLAKPPSEERPLEAPLNAPIAPRIVAGVGVVGVITGVVLLLARPTMPTNCNADTGTCPRLAAQTDAQFTDDRHTAGTNRGLLVTGVSALIGGGVLTATGVLWYVLERKPFETTKPRTALAPWLHPGDGGGVVLRRSF